MADGQQLSERQKTCLQLVANGMSSKEIARSTGLSPRSVDTYLTSAMALLGASNRRDAARIFLSANSSQKLPSQSPPLAQSPQTPPSTFRVMKQTLFEFLFPIPIGGSLNALTASEKLLYSAKIGIAGIVFLLAIAVTFVGLLTVL